jgi:hypothetical protein
MKKIRITVRHNPDDPADDLRIASQIRRDLWAHSPVEVDPDSPKHRTHRNADRSAYFEFATNYPDEVQRIIGEFADTQRVSMSVVKEEDGPECTNCGHVAGPILPSVCPSCGFRDISPCPHCKQEVARQAYLPVSGDLFKCPMCQHRVRLQVHDPLLDSNGDYNQPLVVVEGAEGQTHALR